LETDPLNPEIYTPATQNTHTPTHTHTHTLKELNSENRESERWCESGAVI